MKTFGLEEFLALPMRPCIRLRIGPGLEDVLEIDQAVFTARKQEIVDFCLGIPEVDGMSWQLLRLHTEGNGLLAKMLIALGDLAGAWKMHPDPLRPELWGAVSIYPTVLAGSVLRPPKVQSQEVVLLCDCCEREMGDLNSKSHDLIDGGDGRCTECHNFCELDVPCANPKKRAPVLPKRREEPKELDPIYGELFSSDEYLKQFGYGEDE